MLPKNKHGLIVGAHHECSKDRADVISDASVVTIVREVGDGILYLDVGADWIFIDGFEDEDQALNILMSIYQTMEGSCSICGKHDGHVMPILQFCEETRIGVDFLDEKYFKLTYYGN